MPLDARELTLGDPGHDDAPALLQERARDRGAEAAGDVGAKLDALAGRRIAERLRIGVGDDEVDALDVALDHVGDRVSAGAADADDADPRTKLVDFRTDEIDAHGLNPPLVA